MHAQRVPEDAHGGSQDPGGPHRARLPGSPPTVRNEVSKAFKYSLFHIKGIFGVTIVFYF